MREAGCRLSFFMEVEEFVRETIPDYQPEPPVKKEFIPVCPVCGEECDTVYVDMYDDIVGCDQCMNMEDAYEYLYDEEVEEY